MKRQDFSPLVAYLIEWIVKKGWHAIIGHAERSREEQRRMFDAKLSKCDGDVKISGHQYRDAGGRYAIDIFIHDGDGNIDKSKLYEEAHDYWTYMGGDPVIVFANGTKDWNHFEAH